MDSIQTSTRVIGAVHLTVSDIDRSMEFYREILGFQVHRREGDVAYLGAGAGDLLVLYGDPTAPRFAPGTGFYHFAILVPNRYELAQALRRFAETRTPLQGLSDHFVSEAIYLADPDGIGIEIYADRSRDAWTYRDGTLEIGTVYLEPNSLFVELAGREDEQWCGLHSDTMMGHVHLHTDDVVAAETFYRETLGFDLVMRYGRFMTFMSRDGYHHHLGVRVGRGKTQTGAIGLKYYEIHLPAEQLSAAVERLQIAGLPVEETDAGYLIADSSNNGILLTR